MSSSLLFTIMLIGGLGIGSQWVAWRYKIPAIVVMSISGLIVGPIFGIINPEQEFGVLYDPMISVAVAIILFEGSLNLKFKELTGLGKPLFRIATLGAFIAWILGSLTAHYVAGLSWTVAFVIGGLFIVTGPTVIMPLLRQSKLKPRPAKILRWEGIVVDPFGVLLAVFAFEIITYLTATDPNGLALLLFFAASIFAVVFGWGCGKFTAWLFDAGVIPEFLKSPAVLVIVILSFTVADEMMKGTGLLSVTAMGMTLANTKTTSVADMRHFKEDISILLISSIFIMVAASLEVETLLQIFNLNIIGYVILMMFAVRPLSIFLSTIGTGLSLNEKTLIGWIAPRGIVALTVSSYFASVLDEAGQDASMLLTLTFGLVFFTVVAHGFSLGWLAKKLNLSMEGKPGIIITGSNLFTIELAKSFEKQKTPVIIVDNSWERLAKARKDGVPFFYGSLLSEQTEYNLDTIPYEYLIAATDSHSYNALICTTFMPEYGRNNVFKVSIYEYTASSPSDLVDKVGGRILFNKDISIRDLIGKAMDGYVFRQTTLTDQYNFEQYMTEKDNSTVFLYFITPSGQIKFFSEGMRAYPGSGDTIISITPPSKEIKKIKQKIAEQRNE